MNNSTLTGVAIPRQIRIIVADPYPVIVHGLGKMVEDDARFKVVAEASTMTSFRSRLAWQRADVALVDWSMASEDLAATTELVQSVLGVTSIVFLTVSENSHDKVEMMRLGARGFISKWTSARQLQRAIMKAGNRRRPVEPGAGATQNAESEQALAEPNTEDSQVKQASIAQLTERERQLLPLVCGGLRNKEIALRLGIAETTVWHHLTSIFTKLRVEDRLGLAAFVYRHQPISAVQSLAIDSERPGKANRQTAPTGKGIEGRRRAPGPVSVETRERSSAMPLTDHEEIERRLTGS